MQTPELLDAIARAAKAEGIPLERLRVGSRRNSINPETGLAEFGAEEPQMPEDDPGETDIIISGGPYPPGDPRYETDPEWAKELETIRRDRLEYPPKQINPIVRGFMGILRPWEEWREKERAKNPPPPITSDIKRG